MDKVRNHFQGEAGEFDNIIIKLIPHYPQFIEALISAIPFDKNSEIDVLDLGTGTGTIAKLIKETFPKARIVCQDLAENMLEQAKKKLKSFGNDIIFDAGNFLEYNFPKKFDACISSLAIHHIPTDDGKKLLFSNIYENLKPGGVFYNADVILGPNSYLQNMYIKKWEEYMSRTVPKDEIDNKWMKKYNEEDIPAKLMDQMKWLAKIGYKETDVIWKYYNFAVYGGKK